MLGAGSLGNQGGLALGSLGEKGVEVLRASGKSAGCKHEGGSVIVVDWKRPRVVVQASPGEGTCALDRDVAGLCYTWGASVSGWPCGIPPVVGYSGGPAVMLHGHSLFGRR